MAIFNMLAVYILLELTKLQSESRRVLHFYLHKYLYIFNKIVDQVIIIWLC